MAGSGSGRGGTTRGAGGNVVKRTAERPSYEYRAQRAAQEGFRLAHKYDAQFPTARTAAQKGKASRGYERNLARMRKVEAMARQRLGRPMAYGEPKENAGSTDSRRYLNQAPWQVRQAKAKAKAKR